MTTRLDQHLSQAVASGAVPGVVALAADANGIIYSNAFGQRGPTDKNAMALDTVFRIASMTKAITAAAAMKLVEEGRIGLDQPMKEIAAQIGQAQVLTGFDASGKPQTRAPKRDVTLRHLLTHTSGYAYDLFNTQVGNYMQYHQLPSIATCKFDSLKAPLVFDPGERWEYGIGIDWAGRIVEIVSGMKLADYLDQHFFKPLKMNDTSFVLRDDMKSRLVQAAARTPDGVLSPLDFEFPSDGDFHMGGGGLYSTGPDYLRFTRMILGGGSLDGVEVLKPATVKLMGQNAIGDIAVPPFMSDNPAMALSADLFPGQIARWGLSFVINTEDIPGCRAANSLAWAGVHNTFYWIDPTNQLTAVLMMQLLPANDPKVLGTLVGYEQALYASRR
ncbi:MAG: beta-lactamase family protein [Gammaproteobacteria bacterium]|nr:beta-lactamase family protein [Gammaproteobacteria bacterium]